MDFAYTYTEDQEDFRKEVRSWLEENIPDEMKAPVDRMELSDDQYAFWRDMHMVLADKGWLYPTYPKEYGGGGLTGEHETILQEEFRRASVVGGFTNSLVFPTLLVWADESQKEQFLKPLLSAEKVAFQNFSEPNAGSDLASLQSRAVRDGDDFILNGQKIWISGVEEPDFLFGPFMTDPDAPRHRNLGYFMVPFPADGLSQERMNLLSGDDQSVFFFDNVRIPGDHLIGGDQQGWQVTQTTLEVEHGGRGQAYPRDESLENLMRFVEETERDGESIGSDPVAAQETMSAYIDSHVNGLLNLRNYGMYHARQEMTYHGSQTSMFGKLYRITNADRARDLMGMYSLCGVNEPRAPFGGEPEVYQRGSLVGAHPAGTVEIQKVIIARRIGISRTRERAAATPSTAGVAGV